MDEKGFVSGSIKGWWSVCKCLGINKCLGWIMIIGFWELGIVEINKGGWGSRGTPYALREVLALLGESPRCILPALGFWGCESQGGPTLASKMGKPHRAIMRE